MRKTSGLVTLLLGSVALAPGAFAADPLPPPVVVAPTPQPPPPVTSLAGYVDAHFGNAWHHWEDYFEDILEGESRWRETALGGAGRAAWNISPNFTLQLDAWANLWQEKFEEGYSDNEAAGGVGTHFVFGNADGFRFGALTSIGRTTGVGRPNEGTWANVAGEVAGTFGAFRVSAQGGFTFALSGDARQDGERAYYVAANATFYPNPNLALTGHGQWSRWYESENDPQWEQGWDLGARAEFKLGSSPLSLYAGYIFSRSNGNFFLPPSEPWRERSHTIYAGVRLLLGHDTLQDLDNAVPFADYNPIYGDPFAHR